MQHRDKRRCGRAVTFHTFPWCFLMVDGDNGNLAPHASNRQGWHIDADALVWTLWMNSSRDEGRLQTLTALACLLCQMRCHGSSRGRIRATTRLHMTRRHHQKVSAVLDKPLCGAALRARALGGAAPNCPQSFIKPSLKQSRRRVEIRRSTHSVEHGCQERPLIITPLLKGVRQRRQCRTDAQDAQVAPA